MTCVSQALEVDPGKGHREWVKPPYRSSENLLGFLYHAVSNRPMPHVRWLYDYKSLDEFDEDLSYIEHFYRVPARDELERYLAGERPVMPCCHLSFDDGLAQTTQIVWPRVRKLGWTAFFFVVTDSIENRSAMYRHVVSLCIDRLEGFPSERRIEHLEALGSLAGTPLDGFEGFARWIKGLGSRDAQPLAQVCSVLGVDVNRFLLEERPYLTAHALQQLADEGAIVGAHSRSHARLGTLGDPRTVEEEIVGSCEVIRNLTGAQRVPFAFPFSGAGVDRALLSNIMRRNPFVGPFFDVHGFRKDEPFVLHRIAADTPSHNEQMQSNLPLLIERARRLSGL